MSDNGLTRFSLHADDVSDDKAIEALAAERATSPLFALQSSGNLKLNTIDPETAARQYLQQALASSEVPTFNVPEINGARSNFKVIGTEVIPFTNTCTVKFRQTFKEIPIYGSLITVELDSDNELVAINSSLGQPSNVDPIAKLSPADVLKIVEASAGPSQKLSTTVPQLNYYFDQQGKRWRLVYIVENVLTTKATSDSASSGAPFMMDYVVDAHSAAVVAELPRTLSIMVNPTVIESAVDGLGSKRQFKVSLQNGNKVLFDEVANVQTYDFGFQYLDVGTLPGAYVSNPPSPWNTAGVSAHANAVIIADFFQDKLKRNGIDGKGSPMISSINCVDLGDSTDGKQWGNAAWIGTQMVYGQMRDKSGGFKSFSVALDVVGHEMFHGVTDRTARLEYVGQSGALNESYSDIFGILISNLTNPDISKWDWRMGEELDDKLRPLRDISKPTDYNQPGHMDNFVHLPNTKRGDWGGVHTNSGIPNFAAYKIMTAKDNASAYLFDVESLAALFYIAVTQYLSRTSQFEDSRQAIVLAGRSLFKNDPRGKTRVEAIETAFNEVGIK